MKRLWILSELYYPEESATGHILGEIGEGLSGEYEVHVICAQPTYHQRGMNAPQREVHNGVEIRRCRTTNLNKDIIWQRLINFISISLAIFGAALQHLRRGDMVLVVTNPPLLPFLVTAACKLKRAKCVLLVHDVYPEVAVATGLVKADTLPVKLTKWLTRRLYRAVDHIVVLGRDMQSLVRLKLRTDEDKISIIPNWADVEEVRPMDRSDNALLQELQLEDKFVIQYAGNMGYVHDIETIVASADDLQDMPDVHFLFLGAGAKKQWLEAEISRRKLGNITIIPQRPRADQLNFLNACDIAVMALVPGMLGVSVPSRTYNILAAGKPILAVMDPVSEVSLLLEEHSVGRAIPSHDFNKLASAIRHIAANPDELHLMSERARQLVENQFTLQHVLAAFSTVFDGLMDGTESAEVNAFPHTSANPVHEK